MPNCSCLTAKLKPCKNRISETSQPYNGSYMCFRHIKQNQRSQDNTGVGRKFQQNNQEYYPENTIRCCVKTKKGTRCSKKTKNESGMCFLHEKHKKENINTEQTNKVSEKDNIHINFNICSPNIKFKINNEHDNCYICLEETQNKLSCGHFIHSECLLHTMQNSNLNRNGILMNKIFEHENKYFVVTTCLYCKQIAIVKNIQKPQCAFINQYLKNSCFSLKELRSLKGNHRMKNIKLDDKYILECFNEIFQKYDIYDNNTEQNINEFIKDMKQLIFDKFSCIVFDNYIQQKSICKLPKKYGKIDKKRMIENIKEYINNTLYSKKLYKYIEIKLYNFFEILEDILSKINSKINIQDEYINLMNVF